MANKQQRGEYKSLKEKLEESERSAKYFKSEFERMYYAVEIEKIRPAYQAMLKEFHPELYKQLVESVEPTEPVKEETDGDTKE